MKRLFSCCRRQIEQSREEFVIVDANGTSDSDSNELRLFIEENNNNNNEIAYIIEEGQQSLGQRQRKNEHLKLCPRLLDGVLPERLKEDVLVFNDEDYFHCRLDAPTKPIQITSDVTLVIMAEWVDTNCNPIFVFSKPPQQIECSFTSTPKLSASIKTGKRSLAHDGYFAVVYGNTLMELRRDVVHNFFPRCVLNDGRECCAILETTPDDAELIRIIIPTDDDGSAGVSPELGDHAIVLHGINATVVYINSSGKQIASPLYLF